MLQRCLLAALLVRSIAAVPLNINLGAYSPALVVGDGEISFGGKADVTALMSALEGASVNAQAAAGSGRAPEPAKGTPAVAAGSVPATTPATAVATIPAASSEKTGVDNDPAHKPQLAALQGMGKEIAPRVVKLVKNNSPVKLGRNDGPAVQEIAARDLETLKAALEYSAASLKTGPIVEMGVNTPGMRIKPQGATAVARSIYDEGSHPAPRAVPEEIPNTVAMSKVRTTVTTMYIRGGALNGATTTSQKRSPDDTSVAQKQPPAALDGVNLNVPEGQVAELTFVETTTDPDA